jgi:hypothetical protein
MDAEDAETRSREAKKDEREREMDRLIGRYGNPRVE